MKRAIALVDLDDTLFQTRRKCPEGLADDRLTALGYARDGTPLSFATPHQLSFLHWLGETTQLIPVTARSLDALRRVRIPYTAAICAHGGVVLDAQGEVDPVWAAQIDGQASNHEAALSEYTASIAAEAEAMGAPIQVRVLSEGATQLYILVKHADADAAMLHAVVNAAIPAVAAGWTLHRNGNNVALLPPYLGKARAVAYLLPGLRARNPDAAVIGIGDSTTDAPFLQLCDFAMLPTRSQLADRLFDAG